jgi:hypothetical protein
MARIRRLLGRLLGRRPPAGLFQASKAYEANKWGAAIPDIPAGRLFDERVRMNLKDRIDRLLAEGHDLS